MTQSFTLWTDGAVEIRLRGSLLWTHFGISGPVTLNMSRHWLRATLEQRRASLTLNFCPDQTFDDIERWWTARTGERPHASVVTQLAGLVPASSRMRSRSGWTSPRHDARPSLTRHTPPCVRMRSSTGRHHHRRTRTTTRKPRPAALSLDESIRRRCDRVWLDGLSLVGEMLDVDGRIGGFNFQWAWSSAWSQAGALAHN